MTKLTHRQIIVLSGAAQREDGAATLPEGMKPASLAKLSQALIAQELVHEVRTKSKMPIWRRDAARRSLSLVITRAGKAAIEREAGQGESIRGLSSSLTIVLASACGLKTGTAHLSADVHRGGFARQDRRGDGLAAAYGPSGADRVAQARLSDRAPARVRWQKFDLSHRHECAAYCGVTRMPMHTRPMERPASRSSTRDSTASEIESLNALDPGLLRRHWRALMGRPAPAHLSRSLMVRILAYRQQARAHGDLDRPTLRVLDAAIGQEDPPSVSSPLATSLGPRFDFKTGLIAHARI